MGFNILLLLRMIIFKFAVFERKKLITSIISELRSIEMCCFFIGLDLIPCFFLDSVDLSPLELFYFFPRIDHSLQMNVCILIKVLFKLKWLF